MSVITDLDLDLCQGYIYSIGPFSTNVFKLGPKNDVITNVMNLSKNTKNMNYKRSRTGNNSHSAMIFKLIQIV